MLEGSLSFSLQRWRQHSLHNPESSEVILKYFPLALSCVSYISLGPVFLHFNTQELSTFGKGVVCHSGFETGDTGILALF